MVINKQKSIPTYIKEIGIDNLLLRKIIIRFYTRSKKILEIRKMYQIILQVDFQCDKKRSYSSLRSRQFTSSFAD